MHRKQFSCYQTFISPTLLLGTLFSHFMNQSRIFLSVNLVETVFSLWCRHHCGSFCEGSSARKKYHNKKNKERRCAKFAAFILRMSQSDHVIRSWARSCNFRLDQNQMLYPIQGLEHYIIIILISAIYLKLVITVKYLARSLRIMNGLYRHKVQKNMEPV